MSFRFGSRSTARPSRTALFVFILVRTTLALAEDHRLLWLHNTHLDEELRIAPFNDHGVPERLPWCRINHLFRSHRTLDERATSPRLLRVLAQLQRHFGGRRIELVSGYRTPDLADHLRSYHQAGRAADIYIESISDRDIYDYCRLLPNLGCGLYPKGHHYAQQQIMRRIAAKSFPLVDEMVTVSA